MRKLFAVLAVLLICATIIIGCGTPAPATPTPAKPAPTTAAPATPAPAAPTTPTPAKPAPATTAPASTAPATTPQYGGILRFATAATPATPIGWMSESCCAATTSMLLVMQFLLTEDSLGNLSPKTAESYEVNPDPANPTVTFKLKKGIKFGDGSDFNAQAVKWNLEQVKAGTMNMGTTRYWKNLEALDDYTVRITFTEWQNRVVRSFADASTYMCSPTSFQKNGLDWMRWHMTGTGAFLQTDFQRDVTLKLAKNENYWEQGKPYLNGMELLYVVDEMTRESLLKTGGADIIDASNPRIASGLEKLGYQIIKKQGGANVLVPDSKNADSPWSNLKVRQAAECAIDKESIVKAFGYDYWTAGYQLPTPTSMAYDPNFSGIRKYDPEKAKALLKEAGYPNGFKTKIIIASGGSTDIPVALQSYLNAVGIQTDLEYQEAAKYNTTITTPQKNCLIMNAFLEWPNFNNVLNFYLGVPTAFFPSVKRPDGWDQMFRATLTSPKTDKDLMGKCVRALYDDATLIDLYAGRTLYAATQKVHDTGLDKRSSIFWFPEYTWLSK